MEISEPWGNSLNGRDGGGQYPDLEFLDPKRTKTRKNSPLNANMRTRQAGTIMVPAVRFGGRNKP
ncbi:hypothetical protein DPF_0758 [Desulfoplanes formicivorans]|uniref:Uncharacterized protein n=1 Tax=Desulfoplanes formicivorans TaxID=1592317 RepID=A0A194AD87_9BACT|nr:hypothetical protein DPF_0758 [Desulfoplanes formicivorans]